jgi:deoxycytidylate deaminase
VGKSTVIGDKSRFRPLPSIHAEHDCIRKCFESKHLKNSVILVLRKGKDGHFRNSRPCKNCIMIMKKFGIQKVIYSNIYGGFSSEIVRTMSEDEAFVSLGWMQLQKLI